MAPRPAQDSLMLRGNHPESAGQRARGLAADSLIGALVCFPQLPAVPLSARPSASLRLPSPEDGTHHIPAPWTAETGLVSSSLRATRASDVVPGPCNSI